MPAPHAGPGRVEVENPSDGSFFYWLFKFYAFGAACALGALALAATFRSSSRNRLSFPISCRAKRPTAFQYDRSLFTGCGQEYGSSSPSTSE